MKKYMLLIIDLAILIIIMSTLIILFKPDELIEDNTEKIEIIATLFPQYDFAKHIVGDKADVTLLIKSGVETHNFEPTQKDMININNSDLFLYTGEELEPWTAEISNSISSNLKFANISENIELIDMHEFEEKYENEEGEMDMCKAIDDMILNGEKRGREIGEKYGKELGEKKMLNLIRQMTEDGELESIPRLVSEPKFYEEMLVKYHVS